MADAMRDDPRFVTLADNAPVGILRVGEDGLVVAANLEIARILGHEFGSEIVGRKLMEFLADPEPFIKAFAELKSQGQVRDKLTAIRTVAGEVRQLLYAASLDGNVADAILVDVTARVAAEASLRDAVRKLEATLDALPDFLLELDGSRRILDCRANIPHLIALSPDKVRGAMLREVLLEAAAGIVDAVLDDAAATGRHLGSLYHADEGEGENWFEISASSRMEESGIRFIVLIRNVSERIRAEQGVKRLERLNAALIANAADGIALLRADGHYKYVSPSAIRITGYTLEAFGDKSGLELVHPDDQALVSAGFRSTFVEPTKEFLTEYRIRRADGKEIWIESRFVNLLADPDVNAIVNNYRDITDRKLAQLELEALNRDLERRVEERTEELRLGQDKLSAANAALEKASRLKDEFLASMSHELRTPLTGILGLSEALLLDTYGALEPRQEKALRGIEGSGKHLLTLINDILDLSKVEAGKLELQMETCDAGGVCQASLQLVKGLAHAKQHVLGFSMQPASFMVRADPRRLKQMIVNLLSNAVKFTPDGGGIGLEAKADEAVGIASFSVWDRGIGISRENLGKLFNPFVQIDSSLSRQYAGTGLGLSLVQRMAELHGGGVSVESEPGKGSRFTIRIPLAAEDKEQTDTGGTAPASEDSRLQQKERDIGHALVIEDNVLDGERVMRLLGELGVSNIIHPRIEGAFDLATRTQPGAIILDLNLPDGYGFELLRRLKADKVTKNIPVIIASVEERPGESLGLGAVSCLVKPFGRDELAKALNDAAGRSRPDEPVMVVSPERHRPLVLMADDNELILETLGDFLRAKGWEVVATRSGPELIATAPMVEPDIMLIDIQMPVLDGMETARRIRASGDARIASLPLIAVTALAMSGDRERCLEAGFDEYVSKPVELVRLEGIMRRFLKEAAADGTGRS